MLPIQTDLRTPLLIAECFDRIDVGSWNGWAPRLAAAKAAPRAQAPHDSPLTGYATLRVVRVEQGTATVRVVGLKYPALAEGMAVRVVISNV